MNPHQPIMFLAGLCASLALAGCRAPEPLGTPLAPAPAGAAVAPVNQSPVWLNFEQGVVPVLRQHCGGCHTAGGSGASHVMMFEQTGESRFETVFTNYDGMMAAIAAGRMPLGKPSSLTEQELATLRSWREDIKMAYEGEMPNTGVPLTAAQYQPYRANYREGMRWVYAYVEAKEGKSTAVEQELVEKVESLGAEVANIQVTLDGEQVDSIQVDVRPVQIDGQSESIPGLAGTFLAQGTEAVTVPAGNYPNALRLKLKDVNRQYWLAPGIGIIRAVTVSGPPGSATRITKTLKSFNLGS